MLRGNAPARIDDRGRLKVPTAFRAFIDEQYGQTLYITSLTGENVLLYPMPVWLEIEKNLGQLSSTDPSRLRFLMRVNFYGQTTEFDTQGRVLIPPRLREAAVMLGEVDVLGQYNHLAVWNHERFVAKLEREPFTDEDGRSLAARGI